MMAKKPGFVRRSMDSLIRRPLVEWLGGSFTPSTASDALNYYNGSTASAGQTVNNESAMKLSAFWACNRLLSQGIGTLPLDLYERTSTGRRAAVNHPLYRILKMRPNPEATAATFWESVVSSMLVRGNGFCEKMRGSGGQIVGLKFLIPSRFVINPQPDGSFRYFYAETNGRTRELRESEIFHIPGFSTTGRFGLSLIQYGAQVLGGSQAAQTSANTVMENGLMPTVAYQVPGTFKTKAQRELARDGIMEIHGAMNSGKPVLLESGMTANGIGINPQEAQLLETRLFNVEEICRLFGIDPSLVGHGGKVSNFGTGLEQKTIGFLTYSMRPWLVKIEQSINVTLLSPADQVKFYAEFNAEALLRTDSSSRIDYYTKSWASGLMTADEIRQKENMPAMGGNAAKLMAQGAMSPLDSLPLNSPQATPVIKSLKIEKPSAEQTAESQEPVHDH